MIEVILGLGSNLGDRFANISSAVEQLDFLHKLKTSSFIETPALLPEKHDDTWNIPFINIAVSGFTDIEPLDLFYKIKNIEKNLGRPNVAPRWSPRIIDIDIIFYGDLILAIPELTIPHPEMHKREFVLKPVCEINPQFVHPLLKLSIDQLASLT
jgi:2-amino-4-hydroxy-6-hydroxymethyldihydropteridine diphosphokinase